MELSPNDIRNFEFPSQLRGYDKDAVDNFKEQTAVSLETLKQENLRLSMETESLKIQLSGLKQFEDAIKNAAIDARKNADMLLGNAKHEAELIVSKASAQADQALTSRSQRHLELEAEITKLELAKKSYLTKLRNLIGSHLEWIEDIADTSGHPTGGRSSERLDVTESSEVRSGRRETMATIPSKGQEIHTEEANAASQIVPVTEEAPQTTSAAVQKLVAIEQQAAASGPIDPELAAALENYRKVLASGGPHQSAPPAPPVAPSYVRVTSQTGAVPREYVPKSADQELEESTDKVRVAAGATQPPAPHQTPTGQESPNNGQAQNANLADVLDKVVSKFEEEMDKAAKS